MIHLLVDLPIIMVNEKRGQDKKKRSFKEHFIEMII